MCKKKKIILINYVYLYQKPRFLTWAVRRKLNSLSYLFYNNNIRIEQFKIIFVTPHHSGKKKKKNPSKIKEKEVNCNNNKRDMQVVKAGRL